MTPRPKQHLIDAGKRWPHAWRLVDEMRAERGKGLPDWPEWCFLPLAGAYAIVSGGRQLSIQEVGNVSILGALAAWRPTQGIYRFDPDVFAAVWDTPIEGDLPIDVLYRLPEWCVYIETPGKRYFGSDLHGYFAHLEYDVNHGNAELRFLLDTEQHLTPLSLHLVPGGLNASLQAFLDRARVEGIIAGFGDVMANAPSDAIQQLADTVAPLVSLVLYLCSQAAEYRDARGMDRQPTRPTPQKTKRGERLFPPDQPTVWETAFRVGARLRQAKQQAQSGGGERAPVRPHIRRAHWHTYWVGPRSDPSQRKAILRWLSPIPVGFGDDDDVEPTIRRVR